MTTLQHAGRHHGDLRRREHPEGTLVVTVVIGGIALAWFMFHLWSVLRGDPFLW